MSQQTYEQEVPQQDFEQSFYQGIHLYLATLIVAFCSIVYELILAQSLSIIWGNTIVQYSITIGLYLFSLGMGALFLIARKKEPSFGFIIRVEWILSILGMCLPIFMFIGDEYLRRLILESTALAPVWEIVQSAFVYGLIVIVGLLSGMELPILMELAKKQSGEQASYRVLSIDYIGTFIGTLVFPLMIYQQLGLIAGAALTGGLNAIAALLLTYGQQQQNQTRQYILGFICCVCACAIWGYELEIRDFIVEYLFA